MVTQVKRKLEVLVVPDVALASMREEETKIELQREAEYTRERAKRRRVRN